MTRLILVRIGVMLITFFGASVAIYFGIEALPGDPATVILSEEATPEAVAALSEQMELDRPVVERYVDWLGGFVQGDLGESFATASPRPVWPLISGKIRNTLVLTLATLAILIPLSILIGTISAVRRGKFVDNTVTGTSLTLVAIPEFVIGTLLVVLFAVWLGWLPAVSLVDPSKPVFAQPAILILPVVTLLTQSCASKIRMVRACMIDVLRSDYIEMARLKGVPERRVLLRHALPNALGPTIQIIALSVASLMGGIVIVETVFAYPGIGSYLTSSVAAHDVATVEAIAMLITAAYIVMNMVANISVILLNPRLRRAAQ
jgi:peptide/nickel transport system permease protein